MRENLLVVTTTGFQGIRQHGECRLVQRPVAQRAPLVNGPAQPGDRAVVAGEPRRVGADVLEGRASERNNSALRREALPRRNSSIACGSSELFQSASVLGILGRQIP